ncbi:sensor histidine kinase [Clostridium diolis]|uniref:MASE3 domain-containing sensor histidine kinase n=1 Tax=Clostridium diolis TaxID=223919 RepID=UPI000B3FECAD|nr:MASE3 domain-containing protein [Clostridium diolis]OVE64786.1 sensor histidine kinase [Clostridium diolis]
MSTGGIRRLSKSIKFELLIEWSFFFIFMGFLIIMNNYSNLFFHTGIELFINFIFAVVFVFAFNTYRINKNNFLLILGIGYFFVAVLGIFHMLTYTGMPFLSSMDGLKIATQFWIASRYMGAFTCLIAIIFKISPQRNINPYALFIAYFCITIFLISSICIFKVFPDCYVENVGLTSFKIVSEYVLCTAFLIIATVFFIFGKNIDKYLFVCFECFLILSGVCEMFFVSYIIPSEFTTIIGHTIMILAAYFLYKGVVETGLRKPYNLMNSDLYTADNKVKLFEEIVFNNEECLNMIINNSDNAIFVISNNKFIFANKKMAELLGAEKVEEIIGIDIEKIITDEAKCAVYRRIDNAICNKLSTPFVESKLLRLDGKIVDIEVTNSFCMYKGQPSAMVMLRDITSRRQIQLLESNIEENKKLISKATELNKMMTEFFSNISHELKTPLNVLLGAVQILSLSGNDKNKLESGKYLKTMKQNCYRLVRLVNNLIDISKFDSGYFKMNLQNYNVVSVIEDITLSVADYANNKGIDLIFDTDVEEKDMAIDLDKIERIMLNLLSNAIKFTDKGGQILVNMYDKKDNIVISVKDNGVGMPKDKLNMIFERFGQIDKTLARNSQGSGIGLSLVKSIVDMHNGDIKAFSEFGKGSEFVVKLPVRFVEDKLSSDGRLYESKVEKISIEFSDIYY